MTDLKVGIIVASDFVKREPFGGASGFIENIVRCWPVQVVIFGIGVNGTQPWKPVQLADNVTFIAVGDYTHPSRIPMRLKTLIGYIRCRRRILRSGIDLLYIHSPEIALPFLIGRNRLPVVYHQHGSGNPMEKAKFVWARCHLFRSLFDRMHQFIRRQSDWNIVIDRQCYKQAEQDGITDKTSLLMNAVNLDEFFPHPESRLSYRARYGIADNAIVILFSGRLEEIKRVDRIIGAMRHLDVEQGDFQLFIVGTGSLRQSLENQATREGVNEDVFFLGAIPHQQMPAFYNMADLLVLPSEMEGTPMVILEALACGTPVVATNVGGIPDIVCNGINGYAIDDPEPVMLADAIIRIIGLQLGRKEISLSVSHLGTVTFIDELNAISCSVVGSKKVTG
jgi:glycosyltransferase involved in cell wall biosynthesis